MNAMPMARWKGWIPQIAIACWLLFLGIALWQSALDSVQPPMYDPLGYLQKAQNFWRGLEQRRLLNPLDIEPASRPPGTILMAYPFGYSADFHGFHFRSVFFPILCIVAAVYIAAGSLRETGQACWTAAIALLFSSLPMFYHLDWTEANAAPVRWGLVDNFQAGVAAMATAATIRTLATRSQRWLICAALLSCLTLLIKPSGLMVMGLTGLLWITGVLIEWRRTAAPACRKPLRTYALAGAGCFLSIYLSTVLLCVTSKYFSTEVFAYAKQALVVMRDVLQISLPRAAVLFHQSSGEVFPVWIAGISALYCLGLLSKSETDSPQARCLFLLLAAVSVFGLGAWYWLVVQAGGDQIRYFYPFMLMGGVCLIPVAQSVWLNAHRRVRLLLIALCTLPALNIAALLAYSGNPPLSWQQASGVSVSVGTDEEIVRQARSFLTSLSASKKLPRIYSFSIGLHPAIFENVGMYQEIVAPEAPTFQVVIPQDWLRGFVVRVNEMLECDYILLRKNVDADPTPAIPKHLASFGQENEAFNTWLATLDQRSGVTTVSEGRSLRLLRISDRAALRKAFESFVSDHTWRPQFLEENRPEWWSADEVSVYARDPSAERINFEGIFSLHAISVRRIREGVKVEVWWQELRREEANKQRRLFLHLLDGSANIKQNQEIGLQPYNPTDKNRPFRYSSVTFRLPSPDDGAMTLAFGIFQPGGAFLSGDKGHQDWGGKRILIPIGAAANSSASQR